MIQVPKNALPGFENDFFTIPIHTRITDQRLLGISSQNAQAIAQLVNQHEGETSIKVMFYTDSYLKGIRFPLEIIVHYFIFIPVFIITISKLVSQ